MAYVFTHTEIDQVFLVFNKYSKNGVLMAYTAEEVGALWRLFEKNGFGAGVLGVMLSLTGLHKALQELEPGISGQEVTALVRRLSTSRTGDLFSFPEFYRVVIMLRVSATKIGQLNARLNADGARAPAAQAQPQAPAQAQPVPGQRQARPYDAPAAAKPQAAAEVNDRPMAPKHSRERSSLDSEAAAREARNSPPAQARAAPAAGPAAAGGAAQERMLPDDIKAKAIKAFNYADKDMSGTIDSEELFAVLKVFHPAITKPESNRLYACMDLNRSGVITFDEFLSAILKFRWDLDTLVTLSQQDAKQTRQNAAGQSTQQSATYEWEIPYNELELGKKLGEGTFVYRAKWRGTPVAVKVLKSNVTSDVLRDFRSEVGLMGRMRHPNVVLFLGASTHSTRHTIVSEFLEGGSLHELLHEKGRRLDMRMTLRLAKQASFGLNYLHLGGIVHRDLKSANMLLSDNGPSPVVKLCDFGLSCVRPSGSLTEQVGSPLWMAPELLLKKPYNDKVDIFALSICIWEMLSGALPYPGFKFQDLVMKVAGQGVRPPIPTSAPKALGHLMRCCWDSDPSRRPNCAQVIAQLDMISEGSQ
eukprot:m51a1_g3074 putative protein kinase (587) ;mRNA; f:32885-35224